MIVFMNGLYFSDQREYPSQDLFFKNMQVMAVNPDVVDDGCSRLPIRIDGYRKKFL